MYEIHIKGAKKAVLLTCENIIGYDVPRIVFEDGNSEEYVVYCEVETKWDANPFGDSENEYDGRKENLDNYSEEGIENGDYNLCFDGEGAKVLSGILNVEIEILNKPDDDGVPYCMFLRYANGKEEYSQFKNPEFCGDEPEDMDPEEIAELFDEWHDFSF